MKLCGEPMPKAKNGADRGICIRPSGHYNDHGNGTCSRCGVYLSFDTAFYNVVMSGRGWCRQCTLEYRRKRYGFNPQNRIYPGKLHTFPCGCSDILPDPPCNNKFVIWNKSQGSFICRITVILHSSKLKATNAFYKSIPFNTPHFAIRKMMEEPNCVICGKLLTWEFGRGKTPHLHHNHETGEIYGFACSRCNTEELDALRTVIKRLQTEIIILKEEVDGTQHGSNHHHGQVEARRNLSSAS